MEASSNRELRLLLDEAEVLPPTPDAERLIDDIKKVLHPQWIGGEAKLNPWLPLPVSATPPRTWLVARPNSSV
jgi:hypothetical protein